MLRSLKDITKNYKLRASDGGIGKINDFLFNDIFWSIKFMVVDTGDWLRERLVLLSPITLGSPNWESTILPVNLSKEKIENSPSIEKNKPVSHQLEEKLMLYYAWPADYTFGAGLTNTAELQLMQNRIESSKKRAEQLEKENNNDSHLRSSHEIMGYNIEAKDGLIGNVEDFIIDDKSWIIHNIIVNTRNWLSGKDVLLSPLKITEINWAERTVKVDLNKESIENSPEFDPSDPVNKAVKVQQYDYFGRPS